MATRKKKSTAPEGFPEKAWNKLSNEWRDAAQAKQTDELEQDVIKSVRSMAGSSYAMKNDVNLNALVEEVKLLKSDYADVIAGEKAKIAFNVFLFNSRGMKPSDDE